MTTLRHQVRIGAGRSRVESRGRSSRRSDFSTAYTLRFKCRRSSKASVASIQQGGGPLQPFVRSTPRPAEPLARPRAVGDVPDTGPQPAPKLDRVIDDSSAEDDVLLLHWSVGKVSEMPCSAFLE